MLGALFGLEEQGNAPQAGQTNQGIDDSAEDCILPAKKPRNQVKLENTDQTPVGAADNGKNQRDRVHIDTSLCWISIEYPHVEEIFLCIMRKWLK